MRHGFEQLARGARVFHLIFLLTCIVGLGSSIAQDGQKLYKANCASCHKPDERAIGPALKGARERWGEHKDVIYQWVRSPKDALASGNPYVAKIWDFDPSEMTPQNVSDEEIDAILDWADAYVPPVKDVVIEEGPTGEEDSNAGVWLLVIGAVLFIIILSLGGVNKQLQRALIIKQGDKPEDLPYGKILRAWAWKYRKFVAVVAIFVVALGAVDMWNRMASLGVYQGYEPEQPINFSHKIHAGDNKIHCQYCHSAAEKSKHAMIPSPMVCMNCHRSISKGSLTGATEISKIYKATGFVPDSNQFLNEPQPITWTKVHNLPDFVYFNHSQHVAVGKLECQECHGPVKKWVWPDNMQH